MTAGHEGAGNGYGGEDAFRAYCDKKQKEIEEREVPICTPNPNLRDPNDIVDTDALPWPSHKGFKSWTCRPWTQELE